MTTFFLDYESGNDNYSGTSFNVLASGTDGAISSSTFSSATASFPNNGTIAPLKNIVWYSNFWYGYGYYTGARLLSVDNDTVSPPSGIDSVVHQLQEYPQSSTHHAKTNPNFTIANNTSYVASMYVKASGRNKIILQWRGDPLKAARFDISNGTIEQTGASATSAISSVGDGWYRVSIKITSHPSNAAADTFGVYTIPDTYTDLDSASYSFNGDSTKSIYFCGVQIEAGATISAYEKPPGQCVSIFNGTLYVNYHITEYVSSTSLTISAISAGTAVSNTSSRQYYIGGRWQTFTSGATAARLNGADIIRVKASTDPTSIGNATWDGTGSRPTVALVSSTNATPISITATSHGYSTGDTVVICDHTTNTNANGTWEITVTGANTFTLDGSTGNGVGGATGTVRKINNCVIRLASALTENIASFGNRGEGRTAWTGLTNVTPTLRTTTSKQGDVCDDIAVAAAFTTGLAAYKSFTAKDLSGYQQLSFWIQQTAGTIGASGSLSFKLCSDNAGATAVNTFNLPSIPALNTWTNITIDLASNLGNSIQSIGFYVNTDNAAQTFLFSNIIACKASSSNNSLTLSSLVGKNTTNESWCPLQSINGTRVIIDGRVATTPVLSTQGNYTRGYWGVNETITTYKRECIKTVMQSAAGNGVHIINDGGSHFTPNIFIEGGYDRTNMSTQSGISFFDGGNGFGYGIFSSSKSCINFNKLGFTRYDRVMIQNNFFNIMKNLYIVGLTNHFNLPTATQYCTFKNIFSMYNYLGIAFDFGFNAHTFNNCYFNSNNLRGMDIGTMNKCIFNSCSWNNNGSYGMVSNAGGSANNIWNSGLFYNNGNEGYRTQHVSFNDSFNNCITSGNISNGFYSFGGTLYLNNCTINESTEFGIYGGSDGRIYSHNHDNTTSNHYIYTDAGVIRPQTSVRHTNSGYAWAISVTNDYRRAEYPLTFSVGKVAVSANSLVTIKVWMRRTNIGLIFYLKIKGGQIAGVTNDISSYMTAAADTWEQVSLTFTPTEDGVVEITTECYGGSTFTGYIDDLTITQA